MHVFRYMHFITSFDVAISVMQADGLLNNFDAKTVAFNIIFVCKTSKKISILGAQGHFTSGYKTEISRTGENCGKPCLVCKKTKCYPHHLTSLRYKASRSIPCHMVTFTLGEKKYFDV